MEVINFLSSNNLTNFEDVKMALEGEGCVVKEEGNLYSVYYRRNPENPNVLTGFQRSCNGVIFEKESNKIVCISYDKFLKLNTDLNEHFKGDFENLVLENSVEGTLIRVFYYEGKFRVATKKCIDANKSQWGSNKSFGAMFKEAVQGTEFKNFQFENNKVYFFNLLHPENSVVFPRGKVCLDLLDVFRIEDNKVYLEDSEFKTNYRHTGISSYNELMEYMNSQTIDSMGHQGMVVYHKNAPYIKQRIQFPLYTKSREVFGNEPSLFLKFLGMRDNKEKMVEYIKYFPSSKNIFLEYENELIKFVENIHRLYLDVKVFKKTITIQKNFRKLIYNLHGIYLRDRDPISYGIIMDHLMGLNHKLVEFLYNNYKNNGMKEQVPDSMF
jgi:hypothetical protein